MFSTEEKTNNVLEIKRSVNLSITLVTINNVLQFSGLYGYAKFQVIFQYLKNLFKPSDVISYLI